MSLTISNKITCSNLQTPATINGSECIGDSLDKIVSNFNILKNNDDAICLSLSNTITAIEAADASAVLPPIQSVIMWSGDIGNSTNIIDASTLTANSTAFIYPNGVKDDKWAVCTGATIFGIATPNLIGRFIVGAGAKPSSPSFNDVSTPILYQNNIGGKDFHTLQSNEIPALSVSSANSTSLFSRDPALTATTTAASGAPSSTTTLVTNVSFAPDRATVQSNLTTSSVGSFYNTPHENRPPYYALYYIIRVK